MNMIIKDYNHGEIVGLVSMYCFKHKLTTTPQLREWLTSGFPQGTNSINLSVLTKPRIVKLKRTLLVYPKGEMKYGKYKGKTIKEVAKIDNNYYQWWLTKQ